MMSHSFLLAIFTVVCKLLVAVEQPTITLKEGLPAKIPCMVKGVADAYFWRRGENLTKSDEIATIVFGVPGVVSDAFRVTEDGTLMIYNVTSAIEGRYFCRISTKDNAYFSDVMVLVQVLFDDFGFGIEQCYPKETCTLQVEPYTTTNLTCTATGVSSSISLKWYNGSEVIASVSSEHSSNEESSTVSETITVPNEFGLPLTCEAVASEDGQACARLAHVRLDKTDRAIPQPDTDKSSARWIIPLVLLIVAIVIIVFLLKYIYEKREKYAQKKESRESERETLLANERKLESTTKAFTEQLAEKDEALKSTTKALTEQLAEKDEALKEKETEINTVESKLTAKEKELKNTTTELTTVKGDLKKKTMSLMLKGEEINTIKREFTAKEEQLKNTTTELTTVKGDLKKKSATLTQKEQEIKKMKREFSAKEEELKNTTTELTTVKGDLTKKTATLTQKEQEIKKMKREFTAKEEELKTATEELQHKLTDKDDAVKTAAEELKRKLTGKDDAVKTATEELQQKLTENDDAVKKDNKNGRNQSKGKLSGRP